MQINAQEEDEDSDEDSDGDSAGDDDTEDGTDGQQDSDSQESTTTELSTTTTTAKMKTKNRKKQTTTKETTSKSKVEREGLSTTTTTVKPTTTTKTELTTNKISKQTEEESEDNSDDNEDKEDNEESEVSDKENNKIVKNENKDIEREENVNNDDEDYEEEGEGSDDSDYFEEMSREDLLKSLIQQSFSADDIDLNSLRNKSVDEKWIEMVSQLDNGLQSVMRAITPTALDAFYSMQELSASCSNSLLRIATGIQQTQEWAFKLIDSNGKFPTGLMSGTLSALGAYDQCLETVAIDEDKELFRGQYCILKLRPPMPKKKGRINYYTPYISLNGSKYANTWIEREIAGKYATGFYSSHVYNGMCLPSTCSAPEINSILKNYIGDYFEVTIDYCDYKTDKKHFNAIISSLNVSQRIALTIILVSIIMALLGTLLDMCCPEFVKYKSFGRLMACFSVVSNMKKLFHIDRQKMDQNLGFVHGIRVLTMIWIIAIHTFTVGTLFVPMLVYRFEDEARKFGKLLSTQFIFNGYISVGNFFFLSGLVATYISIPVFKERPPTVFKYISMRWLRFVPPLIGIICFHMVWPLIGSGPIFKQYAAELTEPCTKNWWTNLLFINNWLLLPDMCLVHTWFLSADFQMHILSFFTILALSRTKSFGIMMTTALILCGIAIPSVVNYRTNAPPIPMPFEEPDIDQFYRDLNTQYHPTYNHLSTYFIGVFIGYLLTRNKKSLQISIPTKLILWSVLPVLTLAATFATYLWTGLELEYSRVIAATYSGLHRFVYILFYAWIAIYCATHQKSLISRFLSSDIFIPLSRLSFSVYLTHILIVWYFVLETRELIRFSYADFIYSTGGVILYSLFVALLLYLLFESVWSNVLSLVFKRHSPQTNDRKTDENQSKLSESTNGKSNETDFTINRHLSANGVNKWTPNGCAKDHNGNMEEYSVVAGNVYVDMAHVNHNSNKTNINPSFNGIHSVRNTKL